MVNGISVRSSTAPIRSVKRKRHYGLNNERERLCLPSSPLYAKHKQKLRPLAESDGKIKYGRIQFPTTGDYAKYRNFLYAHYGKSYEWVLKTIYSKSAGYVMPR